ncbi:hypothetical protein COLO4_15076 [Corchorus olitorius]|uniref:Uncharacterized protein n=1 Tax=Corchorus olitorius TaxID=93759 RepID=A0A1R3JPQ1_9ROSI|nr:hypothetical protein COLO4_15076 [Corchorus olitorius]
MEQQESWVASMDKGRIRGGNGRAIEDRAIQFYYSIHFNL